MKQFTREKRFSILKNFWGYGNPETSKILFIGIEEARDWSNKQLDKSKKDWSLETLSNREAVDWLIGKMEKRFITSNDWPENEYEYVPSRTELMQAYLAWKLNPDVAHEAAMTKQRYIQDKHFLSTREFQANIWPIGCRSSGDWNNEDMSQWFPLLESKHEYRMAVLDDRVKALRELIDKIASKDGKPPIIFVMGKQDIWNNKIVWEKVERIFRGMTFSDCTEVPGVRHSDDFTVWLTRHPSRVRWFSESDAKKIVELINSKRK